MKSYLLYVQRAQSKSERALELKERMPQKERATEHRRKRVATTSKHGREVNPALSGAPGHQQPLRGASQHFFGPKTASISRP